jgi:hypothetical protein
MILYHFTKVEHLEGILAEGLRPGPGQGMPPVGVVWLTTDTEPTWSQGYQTGGALPTCRIKTVISTRDRRLVRWWPWARKHAPWWIENLVNVPPMKSSWCYFGTVPHDRFTEITVEVLSESEETKLLRMAAQYVEVAA